MQSQKIFVRDLNPSLCYRDQSKVVKKRSLSFSLSVSLSRRTLVKFNVCFFFHRSRIHWVLLFPVLVSSHSLSFCDDLQQPVGRKQKSIKSSLSLFISRRTRCFLLCRFIGTKKERRGFGSFGSTFPRRARTRRLYTRRRFRTPRRFDTVRSGL